MAARGYFRGHPLVFINNKWVYEDDYTNAPVNGGKIRSCAKCGALFSLNGVDPCLGILPGVDNACCGHGIRSESYIRFANGILLRNGILDAK